MAATTIQPGNHTTAEQEASRSSFPTFAGWLLVFLASLCLYAATANRGPQWQDSGFFIVRVMTHQVVNPLGLALSHPLHHWLGRLAVETLPVEPAFAVTLVSSLAGALAVANVFGCVRTLTGRNSAALYGAASLALANTFWQLSTLAETYTLGAALLAGECWCLAIYARRGSRRAVWGMCLLNGLGLANHLQALLTLPVVAIVVLHAWRRQRLNVGSVLIGIWLWMLASLPYTALVFGEAVHSDHSLDVLKSALFGKSYAANVLNLKLGGRTLAVAIGFPLINFPNLLLPAAAYGMLRSRRVGVTAPATGLLVLGFMIHAAFALRYDIVDQQTFFLPLYVILCILGGVGAAAAVGWPNTRWRLIIHLTAVVSLQITPVLYVVGTEAARRWDLLARHVRHKPYRDDYAYLLIPWSVAERSAAQMSGQALRLAGPDGLIVLEDPMARFAIEYRAMRAGWPPPDLASTPAAREDVAQSAFWSRVESALAESRPVVLVPLNRDQVGIQPPTGKWDRRGDLYVLDRSTTTEPATEAAP